MSRKRNPCIVIDTDAHCGVPLDLFDRYLDEEIRRRPDAPRFVEQDGMTVFKCGRYTFPPFQVPKSARKGTDMSPSALLPGPRGSWDASYRVETFQDFEGVDRSVCMPFGIMFPSIVGDRELGNGLVEAWNDWLHDFCSAHPTRLFGYGMLNIADPAHAVKELRRCVLELGFPSVNINTSAVVRAPDEYTILSDETLYPIWEEAERLGVPISIHSFADPFVPGHERNWPRWAAPGYDALAFPLASINIFGNLVLGGMCEQFPRLRFGIFECTIGWVPQIIYGVHEAVEAFGDLYRRHVPKMKLTPQEYIQRQIYFSVEVEDPFIRDFIKWTKAPDRLLYASDYPHMEYRPGQVDEFLGRNDLTHDEKRRIMGENALGYFRWDDTAVPEVIETRLVANA